MTEAHMHDGWMVRESGAPDADHAVLLLPGALATALFYDDVLAEPAITGASVRFVATTIPGYGGTPALADFSVEALATAAGKLAVDFGCDAVVGHSLGANVALEMAGARDVLRTARPALAELLAQGRVEVPPGTRSPRSRARPPSVHPDVQDDRSRDEKQPSAETARRAHRGVQEERST